jgi:BirA family biotin operon repressor/biotin-[acetyl-CoA-carboxylase] ligase
MQHLHFEEIDSTQKYLQENMDELIQQNSQILISCEKQKKGIGRSGNFWIQTPKSIAFSCSMNPNNNFSLTPLEIGLVLIKYFKQKFNINLKIKWPNDLLNEENKKLGGIISHYYNEQLVIVGIGINVGEIQIQNNEFRHGISSIRISENYDLKSWCNEIYHYLIQNRLTPEEVVTNFKIHCAHQDQMVRIIENDKIFDGIFIGCDEFGSAKVKINETITNFISGTLTILN